MTRSTVAFHNRMAVVFDFDLTLGKGSVDVLLEKLGIEPQQFRDEHLAPLDGQGWDHSLAKFKALVDLSERRGGAITESLLGEVGRDTPLYPGVADVFSCIGERAAGIAPGVEVEFYVLTAGFAEVPRASAIAHEFKAIWGSGGSFAQDGRLVFPKRLVTRPEKVRYLLQLAKGLEVEGHDSPPAVYRDVPDDDWHVPFDQMIYLGDGASDLPAFQLVADRGGIPIGVFNEKGSAEGWSEGKRVLPDRRVHNLACADYRPGSELLESLLLAVESIGKRIALRRLGKGE